MNSNLINFINEAEAAELLTYLDTGVYYLQIEGFDMDKGIIFKNVCSARGEAARKMRRSDIVFEFQGKGGGLFEINTQNNQLIDLNAQSKRAKLINTFNDLKDGETASFSVLEIDPVYCRSVLSKIGRPYTTKLKDGFVHVTKTEKRLSVSAHLKEQINKLENKGIIDFDGDINYLRQIASGLRTPQYRYSVKQIEFGRYEITRLFYEDIKIKSDYYDVIKKDYVDFYLEDNEIAFLNSIVEKLKAKKEGRETEEVIVKSFEPTPIESDPSKKKFFSVSEIKSIEQNVSIDDDIDENDPKLRDIEGMLVNFKVPDLGPDIEDEF